MVGEGGGVLEPDLVHLVRGGENAAERASAYLLLGVDGDLAVALQAATGVVRGTHLGALEVGGELVHSYGSDELHLAHVVVNRASAVARNGVGHDAVGDEVERARPEGALSRRDGGWTRREYAGWDGFVSKTNDHDVLRSLRSFGCGASVTKTRRYYTNNGVSTIFRRRGNETPRRRKKYAHTRAAGKHRTGWALCLL